jgi:hypothetical protein
MKKLLVLFVIVAVPFCPAGAPNTGVTTCATSGSKPVNSTNANTPWFLVQSLVANTGTDIEIGNSNVTTSNGIQLLPGQSYAPASLGNSPLYNLANTYFACATNTDSVRWVYY